MPTPTPEQLQAGLTAVLTELSSRAPQLRGTADPTAGAGIAAPIGWWYSKRTGTVNGPEESLWRKTGTANTAWANAASGGAGGPAIKGTWDVTPTIVPPVVEDPVFVDTQYVSLDVGNVVTTNLNALPPEASAMFKVGGTFIDQEITFTFGQPQSKRIRLSFSGNPFAADNLGQNRLLFGFIDDANATVAGVEDVMNGVSASTFYGIFGFTQDADSLAIRALKRADGYIDSDNESRSYEWLTVGTNTIDLYVSFFEATPVGNPGTYALAIVAVINEDEAPCFTLVYQAEITAATGTVKPFIGFASYDDGLGGGVVGDMVFTIDVNGASDTVPVELTGAPFSQETLDSIIGAPVPPFGSITPEYVTQATLPGTAAVNDLYLAYVDPGFEGNPSTVKPYGEFVRSGEIIRIANVTEDEEEVDVLNEYRNEGGVFSSIATSTDYYQGAPIVNGTNGPNTATVLSSIAGEVTVVPTAVDGQGDYTSLSVMDHFIRIDEEPRRIETKTLFHSDNVNATNDNVSLTILRTDGPGASIGSKILYLDPTANFSGLSSFIDPAEAVSSAFQIYGPQFSDFTSIVKIAYMIVTDAPVSMSDGLGAAYPSTVGSFATLLYNDSANNTVYFDVTQMNNLTDDMPTIGSWNTSFETVNITSAYLVAFIDQPAIAEITASSTVLAPIAKLTPNSTAFVGYDGSTITSGMELTSSTWIPFYMGFGGAPVAYQFGGTESVNGLTPLPFFSIGKRTSPISNDLLYMSFFKYVDGSLSAAINVLLSPEAISGFNVKDDTTIAYDLIDGDFIVRFINSNDVEVSVSLLTQAETQGHLGNTINYQSVIPSSVFSVGYISSYQNPVEVGDVDVRMAWVPNYEQLIRTVNAPAPIVYVRGTDFEVTATNQITFYGTVPTDGYFHIFYDKNGSGISYIQNTALSVMSLTDYLAEAYAVPGFVFSDTKHKTVFKVSNYERPNPSLIPAMFTTLETLTLTEGQLFTVNEYFDPTLGQEMNYKITNALASVSKSGSFGGLQFTKDSYARWDGVKTVPFPPGLDPNVLAVYDEKLTYIDFDTSNLVVSGTIIIDETMENHVFYTTDSFNYPIQLDFQTIQETENVPPAGWSVYMFIRANAEPFTISTTQTLDSARITSPYVLYKITHIGNNAWYVFGPESSVTPEGLKVYLTNINVDSKTRFDNFKDALKKLYDNGNRGELIVDGSFFVLPDVWFNTFNATASSSQITIRGLNETGVGNTAQLSFRIDSLESETTYRHFFLNFQPYLENITISAYSSLSFLDGGQSVFRSTLSGTTWKVGKNVRLVAPTGDSDTVNRAIVYLVDLTTIEFDDDLQVERTTNTDAQDEWAIYAESSLTIRGKRIKATENTGGPYAIGCGVANSIYIEISDTYVPHNRGDFPENGNIRFSQGIRNNGTYTSANASEKIAVNSYNVINATPGSFTLFLPINPQVGDRVIFDDTRDSLLAGTYELTIDGGGYFIKTSSMPVTFNVTGSRIEFVYSDNFFFGWNYKVL